MKLLGIIRWWIFKLLGLFPPKAPTEEFTCTNCKTLFDGVKVTKTPVGECCICDGLKGLK